MRRRERISKEGGREGEGTVGEGEGERERERERENKILISLIYLSSWHTLTTYSKTKVRLVAVWMMSCRVTIFACFSPFSSDAAV